MNDDANLRLIEPTPKYKKQYIDMIEDWKKSGEKMVPYVLKFEYDDFEALVNRLFDMRDLPFEDEKIVSSSTYWLVNQDDKILGVVNIRHQLNDSLLEIGGHIGYGIRPSERKKGYATELLKLALLKAKDLGITKALLTCDKDNLGSSKTITKNGGILASEDIVDGVEIQRYWVEI
jgi:predicted acetyltransferase